MTPAPSDEAEGTRAFVALDFEGASHDLVVGAAAKLRSSAPPQAGLRWTAPEQLHVTVKFLGRVSDSVLAAIGDAVRALGVERTSIDGRLEAISAFPSLARASVLVGALLDPSGGLGVLARRFEEVARAVGVPPEDRAYLPHVTFARLRTPRNLRPWLEGKVLPPADVRFSVLTLYRSDLSPSGARYTALVRAVLAEGESAQSR
jgi:2'-5' RNA ligase